VQQQAFRLWFGALGAMLWCISSKRKVMGSKKEGVGISKFGEHSWQISIDFFKCF